MSETLAAPGVLHAAYGSDPGRVRTNNEDLPVVDATQGVFGVIDGVGGSAAGEVAAAIAREVILHRLSRPLGTPRERVREAIAIANNEIFRRSERAAELRGMSCVVTLALVNGEALTIGHVGDGRLYTIGPSGLRKLTHDHSPVGEREDASELTELEAMRHPRRNEVFREVGGALHDKDEEDFVEVIEAPWSERQALLLCTDGLTDMVPSTAIEGIVRQHAGRPQQVVDALIEAANAAGGTDNVTVVYVEGAAFAAAQASSMCRADAVDRLPASGGGAAVRLVRPLRAVGRRIVRSRTTWLAVGAAAGVAATLAVWGRVGDPAPTARRTLIAGTAAPGGFADLAAALAAAQPGDVVQLEPGTYPVRIDVPDGVDLVARVPGSVTVHRPAGAEGPWVGVTAAGALGGRLSGIRIESTPDAPIDIGIQIHGHGRTIELVDVVGPSQAGIDVLRSSSVVVQGSLLEVPAAAVRLAEGAQVVLTGNAVWRTLQPNANAAAPRGMGPPARPEAPRHAAATRLQPEGDTRGFRLQPEGSSPGRPAPTAAVVLEGPAHATLSRNVIAGFGNRMVEGGDGSHVELRDNLVIPAVPGGPRQRP